ncbi:hypothetical protein AU255_01605 [Methyloprofundus sedimenti]|uniref:O-antigen ligase-related domain-containing protein n=1 Tax=Methyloprofundus sedimenti TaxID=1420851 RepID=A0A1V8M565_9GAMM|nr:O-antigen ligase family protein [Methyloprofundus sedimenti]OQK16626.1 hypothetical protein AU255_01605 [Methyloprofundus sedimenti]
MTAKILITGLMDKFFTQSLSLSLFTMPALVLTVRHGVNISAIVILILSIAVLIYRFQIKIELNTKEKILIFSLLVLPIVIALDVFLRDLNLRYLDYYLRFVLVIPIYLALRKTQTSIMPLTVGILMGSLGAGIFALYQYYYVINHALADYISLGHMIKINFGNISLLLGMMSLAGLILVKQVPYKYTFIAVSVLAFILGITGSIISGARGGWIAIPFFLSLFILYFPGKQNLKIFSALCIILGMLLIYYSNSYVNTRIDLAYNNTEAYFSNDTSNTTKSSTGTRLELWKAARIMIIEHPLLGVGSGQFEQALKDKIDAGEVKNIELYGHVHNESLQILVTTGIFGLLAYLALYGGSSYFFYSSLMTKHTDNTTYLSFLGLLTVGAYFIFGLTNYSFGHHVMILFFAIMVAIIAGMISSIESKINE